MKNSDKNKSFGVRAFALFLAAVMLLGSVAMAIIYILN